MIIDIMGAWSGASAYDAESVRMVLGGSTTGLAHGAEYTGRPATRIYVTEGAVVKLRTEVRLERATAMQWARQAIESERRYQVHHPEKTWFVLQQQGEAVAQIGNICPRCTPLHIIVKGEPPDDATADQWVQRLGALYALNFRVAAETGRSLDEGLSNFGVANNGVLYYLDDDTYSWNRFATTAQMIGTVVRALPWLSISHGKQLGGLLRQAILEHFGETDGTLSLIEQLRDVFIPVPEKKVVLESVQEGLANRKPRHRKPAESDDSSPMALLADIHANLPALESVLERLEQLGIRRGIILGDVVGYGPHPRQCIERLQRADFLVLKGNHDDAVVTGQIQSGMTQHAQWSWEWTRAQLDEHDRQWLQGLPPVAHGDSWMAVHGAPIDPSFFNAYVYHMTYEDNLELLERRRVHICFHGHTHMPGVYGRHPKRGDIRCDESNQPLRDYAHCLVCPGSVGQPRDGRTAAQFGLYDPQKRHLALHTVAYDVGRTVGDMQVAGFPATMITRLQDGR